MSAYEKILSALKKKPKRWLITGVAGFIGSNLLEYLLLLEQEVIGLDNFATGYQRNLDDVEKRVGKEHWKRFLFFKGDIVDRDVCLEASRGATFVLHQAALGSVPRSIADPASTNRANIDGFLHILLAANENRVQRFIYASSSAVYGDSSALPKKEEVIGNPLSPYAVTKRVNELYAQTFLKLFSLEMIGLRYFNVFGPRQDPEGPYAAVIPKWIGSLIQGEQCTIHGDGETSRDFCYIENAVQANILAACAANEAALGEVYNVAIAEQTTLNELYGLICLSLSQVIGKEVTIQASHGWPRPGDIRHSLADIGKARKLLGYEPTHTIWAGLEETVKWYVES